MRPVGVAWRRGNFYDPDMDKSPVSWLFTLILAIGATMRLTRLITADTITAPLRAWSIARTKDPDHPLPTLLRCPWCMGVWTGGIVALWAWADADHWYFTVPALALTCAHAAGLDGARR